MRRRLLLAGLLLASPARAQPQQAADASSTEPGIFTLVAENGDRLPVTAAMLNQLTTVTLTEQGRRYEGPLLWSVLDRAGSIPPGTREQAARAVLVSNQDGDTALVAVGEISPLFASKQAILVSRINGQPLAAGEVDLVVPGDKSQARQLQSVSRIALIAP